MHSIQPYSEDSHIQSFQAGEERGFDHFFRAYYKPLHYFAARYINDKAAIEDIATDAFLDVWNRREKFTEETHLRNYLYRGVYHKCLRWLDNQQRHKKHTQQAFFGKETAEQSMLENIVRTEIIQQVWQALEWLPPACRTIFKKLYVEGKSVRETAIELKLTPSTVHNQKARGIGILRKRLLSSGT